MLDLHFHSDASDGEATFATVLEAVRARPSLRRFALTDHDAIAASSVLAEEDARAWIGAELTAYTGRHRIDLLALGVRPDATELTDYLAARVIERRARFELFGRLLLDDGWIFDPPPDVWAKPQLSQRHVVLELRRHARNEARMATLGIPSPAPEVGDDPAYDIILGPLQETIRAETESSVLEGPDMIGLIHRAGGLAIVAHPWISPFDFGAVESSTAIERLRPLLDTGVDGIELWHPAQTSAEGQIALRQLSLEHDLLVSAGSDDHRADLAYLGTAAPEGAEADDALRRLEAAWRRRRAISG